MGLGRLTAASLLAVGVTALSVPAPAETITVATVNNSQMIVMQKLSSQWEKQTGNSINWVVLEENVLRQRVTTDIATKGGQFDVMTIGSYETPIWGKQNWLTAVGDFPASYDYNDIFPSVRSALSVNGKLYAVPFYAESSFTYYRKDLFDQAGLKMPQQPSYDDVDKFAKALTNKAKEQYGICLRGKPGWGENMAYFDTLVNTEGGRWFDEQWKPQLTTQPWHDALTFYIHLLRDYGPPGASSNGFNENQALFATGKCAMWIDATSGAGFIYDPSTSQVAGKVDFAPAPIAKVPNGSHWFWAWALAIPSSSKKAATAKSFLQWATSKQYVTLVGQSAGWTVAPPGYSPIHLCQPGLPEGGALRRGRGAGDQDGGPAASDGAAGALYRHPICRDPGVPGDRHHGGPAHCRRADRPQHRGQHAQGGSDAGQQRHAAVGVSVT